MSILILKHQTRGAFAGGFIVPFTIVRQDITKMQTDAVVNAANTKLLMGGGVCGGIFDAAGALEMQEACDKLSLIKTGEANEVLFEYD